MVWYLGDNSEDNDMATVKKGTLTGAPEWWKHLRKTKRVFWKRERKAAKREGERQTHEG